MRNQESEWSWVEGNVDATGEHIEIRYGKAEDGSWTPVALVAAPSKRVFTVQFLIHDDGVTTTTILEATHKELDFYLVDKREDDPWLYAKYHCGSAANLYSDVHWRYFQKTEGAEATG